MDLQINKRYFIIFSILTFIILYLLFDKNIIFIISNWLKSKTEYDYLSRDIGTNKDLWLNGYLGIFFRFKHFGFFNWIAIPLCLIFISTIRRRERWEIGIFLSLLLSCIFLSIKGFTNKRYIFTVVPILIPIIFSFGWKFINKKKILPFLISICLFFVLSVSIILINNKKFINIEKINDNLFGGVYPIDLINYVKNNIDDEYGFYKTSKNILLHYYAKEKMINNSKKKKKYLLVKDIIIPEFNLLIKSGRYRLYVVREDIRNKLEEVSESYKKISSIKRKIRILKRKKNIKQNKKIIENYVDQIKKNKDKIKENSTEINKYIIPKANLKMR